MTALLLGLLGVLLLAGAETKRKKPARPPGPEVPIGPEAQLFEQLAEGLAYRREVAVELIRSLLYRVAGPVEAANTLLVVPTAGNAPTPLEHGGAYYVVEALHDQGFIIWVPLGFHWPQAAAIGQFVLYLPPGEPPPPDYVILILPEEEWPRFG